MERRLITLFGGGIISAIVASIDGSETRCWYSIGLLLAFILMATKDVKIRFKEEK